MLGSLGPVSPGVLGPGAGSVGFMGLPALMAHWEATWQAHGAHVPVIRIIRLKCCQQLIQRHIMSSFEAWCRLTVVNAFANAVDFTGGQEALTA